MFPKHTLTDLGYQQIGWHTVDNGSRQVPLWYRPPRARGKAYHLKPSQRSRLGKLIDTIKSWGVPL